MKRMTFIFAALLFIQSIFAGADSLSAGKKKIRPAVKKARTEMTAKQKTGKTGCGKSCSESCSEQKDHFIDKDGDGICDDRAKGMGFNSKNRCSENGCQGMAKPKAK